MAQTKEVLKQDYPLPVYNFRVDVEGTAMSFAEVSGIQVEHDTATYRHGLSFTEGEQIVSFYFDGFIPITLKRGTILSSDPLYLHEWLEEKEVRSLEVSLLDETGTPLISWRVAKAIPVKLEAPSFDADSNEGSIESLELKARGVSVVEHG